MVNGKMFSVPPYSSWQGSSTSSTGIARIKVTLDSPVVRHVKTAPKGIVVIHLRHLGRVGQDKKPASVEILTLTGLYRCQSAKDKDKTKKSIHF